jgi:hypothetical protein
MVLTYAIRTIYGNCCLHNISANPAELVYKLYIYFTFSSFLGRGIYSNLRRYGGVLVRAIELGFDPDRLPCLGEVPAGPGLRRVREGSHQVSPPGRRKSWGKFNLFCVVFASPFSLAMNKWFSTSVLEIRIPRIRVFLGLQDPDPLEAWIRVRILPFLK